MPTKTKSKATDNENATSAENAVNRASSRTPLNDDSHIDPEETRRHLVAKRNDENRLADQGRSPDQTTDAKSRPGPVEVGAASNRKSEVPDTPSDVKEELRDSPQGKAKDAVRDNDA